MNIKIKPFEVYKAKQQIKEFDKQKTYNKFVCNNNYIGLLGEIVLDRYLTEQGVSHTWVPFIKQGTQEPDFIVNGMTIDLKTSSKGDMWVQRSSPHDMYICAQITPDNEHMTIHGWLTNTGVSIAKQDTNNKVTTGNRVAYVINKEYVLPTTMLVGVFPPSSTSSYSHEVTQCY